MQEAPLISGGGKLLFYSTGANVVFSISFPVYRCIPRHWCHSSLVGDLSDTRSGAGRPGWTASACRSQVKLLAAGSMGRVCEILARAQSFSVKQAGYTC